MFRLTWLEGEAELELHTPVHMVWRDQHGGVKVATPIGALPVKESVDTVLELIRADEELSQQRMMNSLGGAIDELMTRMEQLERELQEAKT